MAKQVTNGDLMSVLLDVKQDIGALKQAQAGHSAWMDKHLKDDAIIAASVQKLQLAHARQRGFISAVAAIGSALGAGLATVASKVFFGHH